MKRRTKLLLFIGGGVAAFVIVWAIIFTAYYSHVKKKQQTGLTVRTEKVKLGKLVEVINAPGEIQPRTKVDISAKVSSRVIELPYEEGARVTAGHNPSTPASVLVRLDARDMESKLKSAEASRDAQKAQIEVSKAMVLSEKANQAGLKARLARSRAEFERQKKLLESRDISQSAYDEAKALLEELEAQDRAAEQSIKAAELNLVVMEHNLLAAEARVAEAEEALSYTTIVAPMDGVITKINAEVGEVVMTGTMNNPGTVIMRVSDLSRMIVNAQVDETNVGQIRVGQEATVHVHAFWEEEFKGVVESIALTQSMSNTGTKFYETKILLEGDVEKLYSGLTADVDIVINTHEDTVLVPSQAVLERKVDDLPEKIRNENGLVDRRKTFLTVVYRVNDGKTIVTPVRIGAGDMTHTVIEEGLSADDKIVVGPYKVLETIKHDQVVKEEKAAGKGGDPNSVAEKGKQDAA